MVATVVSSFLSAIRSCFTEVIQLHEQQSGVLSTHPEVQVRDVYGVGQHDTDCEQPGAEGAH